MNFDTSTAGGRLMLRIMLTYANYTREIMSERTSDSMKAHQKRGRAVGGTAPYGFSKVGSRLIENPDEAAGLRRMLELHGQGLGLRAICRSLTRERHPPRGSQWYPQTVRRSLERAGEWLNQPAAQS
jgi:site-specific DNA recombinase